LTIRCTLLTNRSVLSYPERERLWARVERLLAKAAVAQSADFRRSGQSLVLPQTNISPWQPKAKCQKLILAEPSASALAPGGWSGADLMHDQQLGWPGDSGLSAFSSGVGGVGHVGGMNGPLLDSDDRRWEVVAPEAMLGHAVSLAHAVVAPNNTLALAMDMTFRMHRP
jgi:hypothetical protein